MRTVLFILLFGLVPTTAAAAPFRNLGFDEADTSKAFNPGGFPLQGSVQDFLPGWIALSGSNPIGVISVDAAPAGDNFAVLYSGEHPSYGGLPPAEGRFSVSLFPDFDVPRGHNVPFQLQQTGNIPQGAQALHFVGYSSGRFELSLGDTAIPLVYVPRPFEVGKEQVFDVYGDISAFAGRLADLKLSTIVSDQPSLQYGIDSIAFIVPEPAPLMLLFTSGAIVLTGAALQRLWGGERKANRPKAGFCVAEINS